MAKGLSQQTTLGIANIRWRRTLVVLMLMPVLAIAQGQEEESVTQPDSETKPATQSDTDTTADLPDDACDKMLVGEELQEQTRETLRSWSCHSFRWFDSWFGDSEDFDESKVNGWMIAGAEYTQYDGFDPRLRLRVRAPLPNMNHRWDLVLGRVDETAYVSDTEIEDETFFNPGAVSDKDDDAEWLLGLGHRGRAEKQGWDWDAGVRLRIPPRPYTRVQWYYNKAFSQKTDFRYRQTFFWRSDQGFGTTGRADFAHELDPSNVTRLEAIATVSESTQGTQWYLGNTWYHQVSGKSGFSMLAFIRGETDLEVPLQEYGFNFIWRRPFTRDWLYLSLGPSVTWPKELKSERREISLGFGAWLEIEFGDWRY